MNKLILYRKENAFIYNYKIKSETPFAILTHRKHSIRPA